jgi:hypothetical protein
VTLWRIRQECEICGKASCGDMRLDRANAVMLSIGVARHCDGCNHHARQAEQPVPDGTLYVWECERVA